MPTRAAFSLLTIFHRNRTVNRVLITGRKFKVPEENPVMREDPKVEPPNSELQYSHGIIFWNPKVELLSGSDQGSGT